MNPKSVVKRKLRLMAAAAAVWLAALGLSGAAFQETASGGRTAGLGGICVSASDDVNSIYHNPAGLAALGRAEFTAQFSKVQMGLTDSSNLGYSFLGAAQPLKNNAGTLGLGWLRFELAGLYTEDTLIMSYAREGSFIKKPWARDFTFGANLKYMRLAYGEDQYTLNALDNSGNATGAQDSLFAEYGKAKSNIDLDIALLYRPAFNYKIGFMIENLTEPNFALQKEVSAPLWRTYKLGVTYTGKTYIALVDTMFRKFNGSTDWEVSPAGEKQINESVALRGALNIGSRELVKISCGIGYKIDSFQVDYAMVYPLSGVQGTMGDHRISVLFRFGPVIRMEDDTRALVQEYNDEKEAHTLTKKKLQEVNSELERLRRDMEAQLSRPAPVIPVAAPAPAPAPAAVPAPVKTAEQSPSPAVKAGAAAQTETAVKAQVTQKPAAAVNTAAYLTELNQYRRTAPQLNIPQRLARIEAIIKKYSPEVNISEAQQERTLLINEQKAQEKYFRDSMEYYRNMAKYGIKKEEKTDILKRMINKYKTMGIDVSEAQKEIENMEGK